MAPELCAEGQVGACEGRPNSLGPRQRQHRPGRSAALAALGMLSVAVIGGEDPVWAQEAQEAGVGIALDDLSNYPTHLTVDRFLVELTNLTATEEYQVTVSSDSARVGIGGCDTATQTATVTGVADRELAYLVYACAVGEATVTAEVRRTGASSPEASVSQRLTVEAIPENAIGARGERVPAAAAGAVPKAGTPGSVPNTYFSHKYLTSVRANWEEPSDGGTDLTGYGLLFWRDGAGHPGYDDPLVKGKDARSHPYTNLQRDTTYRFQIHAYNGPDSCGYWTVPEVTVKTAGPPKKPHTISVDQRMGTSARVKWSPEADTGGVALTGFGIRWRVKDTSWPTQPQAPNVPHGDRRYTMSPLTANTTYEVSLRSCNGTDSCSPWTDAREFTSTDTTNEPGDSPPGPVRMLRITGVRNGTLDVAWQAPSDPGSTALTGYKLQYKQQSSDTWGSSTNVGLATKPQHTITGRTNGTKYDVRVQACNANTSDPCGDWVSPVCGVPGTTTQAGQAVLGSGGVTATGTAGLRVSWDPPSCVSAITHYEVQRREKSAASSWPATGKEVSTGTVTTLGGLTVGTPYQVRVRACNTNISTTPPDSLDLQCGAWSATQDGTPSGAALPAPENLDVVPLAGRQARLTWNRVTNATKYVVKVQVFGEASLFVPRCIDPGSGIVPQPPVGDHPKCAFKLDEITTKSGITVGLADEDAYQFHVIAEGSGFAPSRASETVSIIDTPIIAINGHTTNTGATDGEAEVQWKDVPTILADHSYNSGTYQFRYRRSSYSSHDSSWELDRYSSDMIEDVPAGAAASRRHTIDELFQRWVYAIQLIYTSNGRKVFSARDMYVWPSNTSMGQDPIATFEKGQMSTSRTSDGKFAYNYLLCESTFPAAGGASIPAGDHASSWPSYVEHALNQWDYATNGLVKMIRGSASCSTDRQPFLDRIVSVTRAWIMSGEIDSDIDQHIADLVDSFRTNGIQIRKGPLTTQIFLDDALAYEDALVSEILMIRDADWSNEDGVARQFHQVGSDIGLPDCGPGACAHHASTRDQDGNPVQTTDIYLRESVHSTRIRLGSREEDKTITFNKCPNTSVNYNYPYSSLVHEAGHAIGFGGVGSHSTVPNVNESIMSYYKELPKCAPHPLDVMIVYAMYQSRG